MRANSSMSIGEGGGDEQQGRQGPERQRDEPRMWPSDGCLTKPTQADTGDPANGRLGRWRASQFVGYSEESGAAVAPDESVLCHRAFNSPHRDHAARQRHAALTPRRHVRRVEGNTASAEPGWSARRPLHVPHFRGERQSCKDGGERDQRRPTLQSLDDCVRRSGHPLRLLCTAQTVVRRVQSAHASRLADADHAPSTTKGHTEAGSPFRAGLRLRMGQGDGPGPVRVPRLSPQPASLATRGWSTEPQQSAGRTPAWGRFNRRATTGTADRIDCARHAPRRHRPIPD
jgi:hypothetical protein